MTSQEFWSNFLSNSFATLLGVVIGIPIALWVERVLEKQRINKQSRLNLTKIEDLLTRVYFQNTNIEQKLSPLENDKQHQYMIYTFFPEVELLEIHQKELSKLETKEEMLLIIDIVIGNIKSLNNLLAVNRTLYSYRMNSRKSKISHISTALDEEFSQLKTRALDSIRSCNIILGNMYPGIARNFPL
ncbi:MAG: hypothetical protein ABSB78_14230 [Bacteroidota bacterium]